MSMFPGSPGMPSSPGACSPGSPSSTRSLDDLLMCPVCLDNFRDPKTLQCLHSFCAKCLENCRRPYRRDLSCPVCKKVTSLTPLGIQGLQDDFRIQQIKDILINRPSSPSGAEEACATAMPDSKACDLCKSQQRKSVACAHCIQCYMYFCNGCTDKHNSNHLFTSHHVINMNESNNSQVLFCKAHTEHPVRYFCKPCSAMMCTICTMEHEPSHAPEPLEKGIIEKYRKELRESLRTVKTKISEVKSKTKYLETVKQSYQRSSYEVQTAIKEKTEDIIGHIREHERKLLEEAQLKFDVKLREYGIESLSEINFHRANMEALYSDIQTVIQGSPQQCLVAYEDIIARMKSISETSVPSLPASKANSMMKFVPAKTDNLNIVIGSLQECSLAGDSEDEDGTANSPSQSPRGSFLPSSPKSPKSPSMPKRMCSILNALTPGRKGEVKIGKVKAFSTQGQAERTGPASPSSTINVNDLVSNINSDGDEAAAIAGPQSPSTPTASSSDVPTSPGPNRALLHYRTKGMFNVDQIGGWPGKISSPSGVGFLPTGDVIVAECENRLQVFNKDGHSVKIIGWGKIKPQSVLVSPDGKVFITDKKDRCIKVYQMDGECCSMWGKGFFIMPSGLARFESGNFVVTDVDRHSVSIHNADGSVITNFGSWGSGDYQFNNPVQVAIDKSENIIVSDSCNGCIKIYDKNGRFIRKFSLQSNKQTQLRRPQGIAIDEYGNILVADKDSHRISMFTNEGQFLRHLLTKQDNIKYPCGVAIQGQYVAVVETHSGFLTKDPHHAVKLYGLS